VEYEIAQVKIFVENRSPESAGLNIDGIVVFAEEKVRDNQQYPYNARLTF
jgi:hypothetical protein